MTTKTKLVFLGSGSFGLDCLDKIKSSSYELSLILTSPDKPAGRSLKPTPTPVKQWAIEHKIPLEEYTLERSAELLEKIKSLNPDFLVVVAFGVILKKPWLAVPRLMCLNVHPSLLPLYRGAAPIHWPMINGDKETGVSIIEMNEKLDSGRIVVQKKLPITAEDDFLSLEKKLKIQGAEALLEAMDTVEDGSARPQMQDESRATHARKLTKEDGMIDWNRPASAVLLRHKALKRWPGSYFFYKNTRVLVEEMVLESGEGKPGSVLEASARGGLVIAAKNGALRLVSVKPEGKKSMSAADFLRGFIPPS